MQKWEYLFVVTESGGFGSQGRVMRINGKDLHDWKKGPHWIDYINMLGEQGWEIVLEWTDAFLFKRPKP